jgi:hypothetical protein
VAQRTTIGMRVWTNVHEVSMCSLQGGSKRHTYFNNEKHFICCGQNKYMWAWIAPGEKDESNDEWEATCMPQHILGPNDDDMDQEI